MQKTRTGLRSPASPARLHAEEPYAAEGDPLILSARHQLHAVLEAPHFEERCPKNEWISGKTQHVSN